MQSTAYSIALIVAALVLGISAAYMWWRHRLLVSQIGAVLFLFGAMWTLGRGMRAASTGFSTKVFWNKVQCTGQVFLPETWFIFVLTYTNRRKWLTRYLLLLLSVIPIAALLLAWTNEFHRLFWRYSELIMDGSYWILRHEYGVAVWVLVGYTYLLLFVTAILLLRTLHRARRLKRWQATALLIAASVPWLGSALLLSPWNPLPNLDLTPLAFALTGIIVASSFRRLRRRDIVPIAREIVIESMEDAVVVLDAEDYVLDLNPAAEHLIGPRAIGKSAAEMWPEWDRWVTRLQDGAGSGVEVILDQGGEGRTYDVRISPLTDWRGNLASQVVVLRDITRYKQADEAIVEQRQRLEQLVQQRTAELTMANEQLRQEVVERERAEKRMRRFLNRQIVVNQLTLALGEARSLDRIYHTIYEHVCRLVDVNAFIVSSCDGERNLIRAEYVVTDGTAHDIARFPPIPLEEEGFGTQSQVIRTGEPFYVPDWREAMAKTRTEYTVADDGTISEGPLSPEEREESANSALFVPMRVDGGTVGVIQIQSRRLDAYTPDDIDLLSAMANVAAIAVQNARLYAETRRSAQQMQALYETSRALSLYFEEAPLMRTILETVYRTLGCEYVIVSVVDRDAQTIEVLHGIWRGEFDRSLYEGRDAFSEWKHMSRYPLDHPDITADVYRTGRTEIIGEWDERLNREIWDKFGHERLLRVFMPIRIQDRVIGVVEVAYDRHKKGRISGNEVQVLAAFMDQAAVAIENVRLFETEREQRELAEALEMAAAAVNSTLDLDQVLDRILEQVTRVVPGDACNVMLVEGYSAVRVMRWRGYERLGMEDVIADMTVSLVDLPNLVRMVRTGEPCVVQDTVAAPDWVPIAGEEALRSHVSAPIRVGGLTVGFLNVDGGQPGQFSPVDAQKLQAFADHAATAIANAYLYAEQRRRVEETGILLEIASAVNSTLELDRVFKEVALRAARACQANRCTILLLDEEGKTLRPIMSQFASGEPDPEMWQNFKKASYPRQVEEMPEVLRVLQGHRPLFVPDARASSIPPQWSEPFDVRSLLVVPLVSRERVVGLMALDRPEVGRAFTREQIDLAMTIGAQAAVAIENARLHQELQDYAHQLEGRVQERTAQLQVQYAQLEAILRSSSNGIIVADSNGEILHANPIADAWLAQTLSREDAANLRETVRDLARQTGADRASGSWPETMLELTGVDLELHAAPILGTGMGGAVVVIAVHDITHLRELDRIKSRFVTNISHELRTPVTTIKLYTMLMRQASPEKLAEYLDTLAQETDRLARLIENILQISRIDAGRLEMEIRPVALNELTAAVIENHRASAQERGLTLEYQPADPGPVAPADPTRIMQVLTDLVMNAIQYTPEGGRVMISTDQAEADGQVWATVTVVDTGMGIPEGELAHVFERFFRGELPQRMQISGTGLGLAIAKEIVELHGGQMTVESQVDVGSTFTVRLPLA